MNKKNSLNLITTENYNLQNVIFNNNIDIDNEKL